MRTVFFILVMLGTSACDPSAWMTLTPPEKAQSALEAPCDAPVIGTEGVDIELDYLPHVIKCENGNASYEALKAQAVAARSYLYYKIINYGQIADGQSDQVYSCGRYPSQIHYDAVADTAGIHLVYQETQVSTFYVAGAHPSDQLNCVATADDPEDFNTEHYVTYNWAFYGDDVEQTSLGWIDEDNLANRGCMSQNGSDCLSDAGWGYEDILRFYYGMDIGFAVAEGECLEDIPCEEDPECNENETQDAAVPLDDDSNAVPVDDPVADPEETPGDESDDEPEDESDTNPQDSTNQAENNNEENIPLNPQVEDAGKDLPPSVVSSCKSAPVFMSWTGLLALFLLWRRRRAH